jgi:hypothetical protein
MADEANLVSGFLTAPSFLKKGILRTIGTIKNANKIA